MAHDVFISYSTKDKTVADAVCANLESRKIRCWIAPRDVLPGVPYAEALIDGLNQSRILILVFSANSNNSPQVMREVERAVHKGISIIPLQIEDVVPTKAMEYFVSSSHWLDALTPPLEMHLKKLTDTVQTLLASGIGKSTDESINIENVKDETNKQSENPVPESSPALTQPTTQPVFSSQPKAAASGFAMKSNVAGVICYILGCLSGIICFLLAKKDNFIRFHALQSIFSSLLVTLIVALLVFAPEVDAGSMQYWILYASQIILAITVVPLWIFLMIRAYTGNTTKLPLIGKLAWNIANRG